MKKFFLLLDAHHNTEADSTYVPSLKEIAKYKAIKPSDFHIKFLEARVHAWL